MTIWHVLAVLALSIFAGMIPRVYGSKIIISSFWQAGACVSGSLLLYTGSVGLFDYSLTLNSRFFCAISFAAIAGCAYVLSSCILSKPRRAAGKAL